MSYRVVCGYLRILVSITQSYYVSLRSYFSVVVFVMISTKKRCSVRLYPQLLIGGSCLICVVYLIAHRGVIRQYDKHGGYFIRSRNCASLTRIWVNVRFLVGSVLIIF